MILTLLESYLNDADATDNSHDDCGFFKTGDVVKKIGDHYFILGRISVDSQFLTPQTRVSMANGSGSYQVRWLQDLGVGH